MLPAALSLTVGVAGFRHGPSPLLVRAESSSLYRVGATGIATRPRSGPRPSGCRMGIRDGYPALSLVVVPGWSAAVSSVAYRGVGGSICRRGDLAPWVVQTPPRLHVDRCRSLQPLRRRFQDFIDRRFYRGKYDVRKTLEAFSSKLRDETDLAALRDDLVIVVRRRCSPLTSRCGYAARRLQRASSQTSHRLRVGG